jgi:flagellar biosynthesis/type III secretory pathway ATPase
MDVLVSREQLVDAALVRKALSSLERAEDLFAIGAYRPGGDLMLDAAVASRGSLDALLFHGRSSAADPGVGLHEIASALRDAAQAR